MSEIGVEKRIIIASAVFVLALTGIIGMSVRAFGFGLPTCLTDVRPFREASVVQQTPKRYEVHYVARMWAFEPAELAIEPGSTVDFYLSTTDVTHGMQIIGTNVNLMAVPGAVNYARVKFDRPGEYLVVCNEYCGISHHNMAGRIHVSAQAAAAAQAAQAAAAAPVEKAPPSAGEALLDQYGCTACHSIDGSQMSGPTFKGLYHSKRTLADGRTIVVEDDYLTESIEKPDAKVAKGFEAMPPIPVPPADVKKIVEYIETLK